MNSGSGSGGGAAGAGASERGRSSGSSISITICAMPMATTCGQTLPKRWLVGQGHFESMRPLGLSLSETGIW